MDLITEWLLELYDEDTISRYITVWTFIVVYFTVRSTEDI